MQHLHGDDGRNETNQQKGSNSSAISSTDFFADRVDTLRPRFLSPMSRNVCQVALRAHAAGERESEQLPEVPHKILLQAADRAIRLEFYSNDS